MIAVQTIALLSAFFSLLILAIALAHMYFGVSFPEELCSLWPSKPESPLDKYIGQDVSISKKFTRHHRDGIAFGRVRIGNETWTAKCADDRCLALNIGDKVRLIRVDSNLVDVCIAAS